MKTKLPSLLIVVVFGMQIFNGQTIGSFTSVTPTTQTANFVMPSTHTFQKIIEVGDALDNSDPFPTHPDFTGYVPIANSSTNGYLSINAEAFPGANTVLDIQFNNTTKLWETTAKIGIDFSPFGLTVGNCSGTVTSWGNVISSEELANTGDFYEPFDGYYDVGWNIELNPATKTVVKKLWAMGNFAHENVTIHSNDRTVYQGADSNPGYLYKFVADTAQDLSSGNLYVYVETLGVGSWVLINDSTNPSHQLPSHRNNTLTLSANAGARIFKGIEDVEIGPDGWIYFAVKTSPDKRVYRLQDLDPLGTTSILTLETFVGNTDANQNMTYDINDGTNINSVAWGSGNDNLAFDGEGNLWVMQDGGNNYIWVVKNGHTEANPKVEIFGIVPTGSEPTGITFTPDFKYLFMSIQHPTNTNAANQIDAAGNSISFSKGTTLVIALQENLGNTLSVGLVDDKSNSIQIIPNPVESSRNVVIKGTQINNIKLFSVLGKQLLDTNYSGLSEINLNLKNLKSGLYLMKINNLQTQKLVIK